MADRIDERADEIEEASRTEIGEIEIEPPRPKTAKEREAEKQRKIQELEEEQKRKKAEAEYKKELERRRNKRKLITPAIVLIIGAISSITMFCMRFENSRMLKWLLAILLCSWIIGSLIQFMFEHFARQNEENVSDEGEVINKGMISTDNSDGEVNG